jgi:hypothetical protein
MKVNKFIALRLLSMLIVIGLQVVVKSSSKNTSRGTGWNDSKKKFKQQETRSWARIFVEGGTLTMGKVQDDVMHDWNNTPTQQHVNLLHG